MNSLKIWIHGLAAAAISAFASAASGAIALPAVFTFDRAGFVNMVKLGYGAGVAGRVCLLEE